MPGDYTRLRFSPANDASGVLQQQGRVMLDQDWNELVEIIDRRRRAETVDIIGAGVVPRDTPHGFEIQVTGTNDLTIGPGRIYVDGLLAENHGSVTQFDPVLEEMPGTQPIAFAAQPYIADPWPFGGNNPFAVPTGAGPHLVYLDVWKREVTYLQAPDLVDKAVGLDTTTRLQTAWQVKVLLNIPTGSTCGSPLDAWTALTAPSAGRLTTAAAGVPQANDPCIIPPNAGYRGTGNRTYRIEVHTAGGFGTALFKWSRDNASVATQVTAINATANALTVVRTKRDSVLRFTPGAWVEVTDDFHELGGVPGEMHQVLAVDDVKLTITLKDPLTAAQFSIADPTARNTRVILWNESGTVRDVNNNIVVDVDQNGGLIPIVQNTTVVLEDGIQVTFSLDPAVTVNPQFHLGDYWIFTARVVDASIDVLTEAPPRGVHDHFCRLAVVTFPGTPTDCRTFWPPDFGGDCECAACVKAEDHNSGKFTIQNAIDQTKSTGGKVCLGPGVFQLKEPIRIVGAVALQLVGHGQTVLVAPPGSETATVPAILVDFSSFVTLTGFRVEMAPGFQIVLSNQIVTIVTPGIMIQNSASITVERCQFHSLGNQLPANPAVALGGFVMQTIVRQNSFAFQVPDANNTLVIGPGTGVGHRPTIADKPNLLLFTFDLYVEDNFMQCGSSGISLDALSYHALQVGISGNFIGPAAGAGITVAGIGVVPPSPSPPWSRIEIAGNEIVVTAAGSFTPGGAGHGIVCGVGAVRISDNDVVALGAASGDGILLDVPLNPAPPPLDGCQIIGNRVTGVRGIGIEIRAQLASAMIKQNTIQDAGGGGIVMTGQATAQHLSIANNQLLGLGPSAHHPIVDSSAFGVRLGFVHEAEIEGNIIRDLGMNATSNVTRVGIALTACLSARIAGNQIANIGPLQAASGPSAGIVVTIPFDRAEVSNNVIRRSDPVVADLGDWRALYVGPPANFPTLKLNLVPIAADRSMVVGDVVIAAAFNGIQLAAIRGNVMAGGAAAFPPDRSFVESSIIGSCIFTDNQCMLAPGGAGPLARLAALTVAAANNILTGGTMSLQIAPLGTSFTVVGNITSTAITVNGAPLALPWLPLNAHG